jgi:hypothetical protein
MTTKPDFQAMPMEDLKAYILANRNDDEAFYVYIDRKHAANPNAVTMTIEQAEAELQRRFSREV